MSNFFVEQEYRLWRKNVKYLYDLIFTQSLTWPSPTIQWLPNIDNKTPTTIYQKIVFSTFTGKQENENILIGGIEFPDIMHNIKPNNVSIKFSIEQSIPVSFELNKINYCPHASNLLACKTDEGPILIYDISKNITNQYNTPSVILQGHTSGGFALDWNKINFGKLISGGNDKFLLLFDINKGLIHTYNKIHTDIITSVSFNNYNPKICASVSDDSKLCIIDISRNGIADQVKFAHNKSIEGVDFSPFRAELIATCSSDKTIKIWDMRHLHSPIYILRGHKSDVMGIKWSLHYESILASNSKDKKINIWDLNKGNKILGNKSDELLFIHGGHTNTVADFDWNPAEPMEICSVDDSNMLHIWKIPIENYI
ncbi:histone acetyltransferase complex, histone binding subunit HAT2 [Enterocytozoon bieneusi H348]|nr:histone acetyltransferase complex, histone binding subunit HAT2 [Enterocytozoon bieneusi H348]|eukprot:XP_002649751.1 histone acetyltransferase complex, histone binding subunit HAT2 [Enterocytozoon bieneusi H348]